MNVVSERVYTGMSVGSKTVGGFLGPIFIDMVTKKAFCPRFHDI